MVEIVPLDKLTRFDKIFIVKAVKLTPNFKPIETFFMCLRNLALTETEYYINRRKILSL